MRCAMVFILWGLLGMAGPLQASCLPGDGAVVHARYQVDAGGARYPVQLVLPPTGPGWLMTGLGEEGSKPLSGPLPVAAHPREALLVAPALFSRLLQAPMRGREVLEQAGFELADDVAGLVLGCPVQAFAHPSGEVVLWLPAAGLPVSIADGQTRWQLSALARKMTRAIQPFPGLLAVRVAQQGACRVTSCGG